MFIFSIIATLSPLKTCRYTHDVVVVFLYNLGRRANNPRYTIASISVRPLSSIGGSKPDCLVLLKQKLRR